MLIYKEIRVNTKVRYDIKNLDCPNCAIEIEKDIQKLPGVEKAHLNFINKKLEVRYTDAVHEEKQLERIAKSHESEVHITLENTHFHHENDHHPYKIPLRVSSSILLLLINYFFISSLIPSLIIYIASYLLSGYDVLLSAFKNMLKGRFFDEKFLMSVATIGAFIIKEFPEATAVMAFYQIGEYFQGLAVEHSRKSVSSLIEMKPTFAFVKSGERIEKISVEKVKVGDIIVIKPGMSVPVDMVITSGISEIDERALTGESKPVNVTVGSLLLSGSINANGLLIGSATSDYENSTVARLLHLVEDAGMRKAKTERFITRFSAYYTPIVVFSALFVAFIIPLLTSSPFDVWIYRALVFLVVSCPCALVLSVPLGMFAGIGSLARNGVLVKGGNFLESLHKVSTVVFDKTGTITTGELHVKKVMLSDSTPYTEEEILYYAASLESLTHHVIARSITSSFKGEVSTAMSDITEHPGKGITGSVDGKKISVTNHSFVDEMEIIHNHDESLERDDHLFVSIDNTLCGTIVLSDRVKDESKKTITELKKRGIETILLSGDSEKAVKSVALEVGIDTYYYRQLPHEKLEKVEEIIANKKTGTHVVFVGDGINDAPVLRMSDIGISMGTMGSDAAIESSDIVIMKDDLGKIIDLLEKSKKTMAIVTQNITFAISIKILVMILSLFSLSTLWMAVFADTGVALLAVANSLRIIASKRK